MIFERQKYIFIFQDAVYSMAVGFITGFFGRTITPFLYKGKVKLFIKDMAVCTLFSVLLYSYVISFANYKVLRWYNVLFAVIGHICFTPLFEYGLGYIGGKLGKARKKTMFAAGKACRKLYVGLHSKIKEKYQKNTIKNNPEPLKEQGNVLYN